MSNTRRHILYSVVCHHCHTSHYNENGLMLWPDKDAAVNAALEEGWLMHRGRLYCPTCIADKQHLPPKQRKKNKMKNNPPILDACCGGKMFYFDKNDPRVLFQDIREVETTLCDGRHFEVKPDVQADFTNMPYPDDSFAMVVFDPPHLKYTGPKKECDGWQMLKYGNLGKDWRNILSKGFAECFRVLKPGGFLIFKWNEVDIKVTEILKLTPAKPIFGHISGKRANTHWICFIKE